MSSLLSEDSNLLSRKEFLGKCVGGCLGVLGIATLASSCSSLVYIPYQLENKLVRVNKSDLFTKKMVAVRVDGLNKPILIVRHENAYKALLMECTHKQCELTASTNLLVCPCHGSEFDLSGNVLQGPAENKLISFKVTEDESFLYIS